MILDYVSLALRNIRKRGVRSWLTMLGIFIGIAAVVSLISMGSGLKEAITGQFGELGADQLVVQNGETGFGPPGSTAVEKLTDHDVDLIRRVSGVEFAVPRLLRTATVEYDDDLHFGMIGSLPDDRQEADIVYGALNAEIGNGRLLSPDDRGKVVVGADYVDDVFGKEVRVGSRLVIQGSSFQVVGIFKESSSFIINSVILMPEADMKNILGIGDEIDLIAVQVISEDRVEQTARDIEDALRRDRNIKRGQEDFSVQTPAQSLAAINTILSVINIVVIGIAIISLFVGGIGITNTMYTSVLERTKEIGVMKSIGARNKDVLGIFLIESSMLGLVGGVIGALIGLGFAYLASLAVNSSFPGLTFAVSFSFPLVFGAILFSLVVGTISGIVPAFQASRMKPVEALRS